MNDEWRERRLRTLIFSHTWEMFEKGKFGQTKKDQEPFSFFRNFFSVTEVFCAQEDCQQLRFHSWSDSAREESDYPWRWGISPFHTSGLKSQYSSRPTS
tara:strand:- start:314 stop:610 length:297 start_codon:yes stop_codon:yes gene_type:complete